MNSIKDIFQYYAAFWLAVAFIFFCAGLIFSFLYFKFKSEQIYPRLDFFVLGIIFICLAIVLTVGTYKAQPTCPACGKIAKTEYCTHCGQVVEDNIDPTCPTCENVCYTDFCGNCGAPMNQEE